MLGECFPSGDTFRVGYRQVWFDDVATDQLEKVQAEFDAALKEQSEKGIDPTRMQDIIARQKEDARGLRGRPLRFTGVAGAETFYLR